MARDLTDRVLVITGGSSGIGAAIALAAARAGMHLVLGGRRVDRLAAVAEQVRALGRRAETVVGEVTSPGSSAALLDCAQERLGGADVVIANAGYGFNAPLHATPPEALREIFEVNFFAAVELIQRAAQRWIAQGRGGHLLMTSSAVAKFTLPSFGAYSATKAAQNHACRAMRLELRRYGIEVSSIHPTTTRTEFFDVAAQRSADDYRRSFDAPAWMVQPPEAVARAVIRCLRRPRAEVWTAAGLRLFAGLGTAFPRIFDRLGMLMQRDAGR